MKSSASESIIDSDAEHLVKTAQRSFCLDIAQPEILPLERLWNGFDSDAELFMYQT